MNWLDLFIVLFLITALVRGTEVGFIRQFCSTLGFFIGLFLGAWLQHLLIDLASSPNSRALLALCVTLGLALALMTVGEYLGLLLKFKLRDSRLTNKLDKIFGSILAAVTILAAVWLGAAVFRNVPDSGWQRQIRTSRIVTFLDSTLPSAPNVLTRIGHLIDPNTFPQVFTGLEPTLQTDAPLPDMGELNAAVQTVRPSVVKIEGEGCNNIVEGSGFMAAADKVITNAHVVAGVKEPYVLDQSGRHRASVVLFDPNLDLAILRTSGLASKPLALEIEKLADGTPTAVLGYPAGAGFTAGPGVVLETFTAQGRNIYNEGNTERQVYSVKTDIVQGNSGGPMVNKDGEVVGVIFAKSINYDHVGYALTMDQVIAKLNQAKNTPVSTDTCAE
jgi:S1-C subfamily serine protease